MFISVVNVFAFFLRFVYGPLKKRGFRENATGKERPNSGFVWCCRVEFVAIINYDVGKHAGGFNGKQLEDMRAYPPIKLLRISLKEK